ncbi:MAG TPA: hypothetical protein PL001_05330 [Candidatus Kryptobacter bacterium]|nr:MAG: hypothetical protein B7Z63_01440 [Ignavibacteriae bacterium 37-53-5]HQT91431.1 hypothetical protein [Candidatus Kryptobacter bacterium]
MRHFGILAIGFVVFLFSVGPLLAKSNDASEKFQQSYALSAGGTVSLQNINGNVKITTWDKNEVKIEAVKYADDKNDLDNLKIEIDASNDIVAIHTRYPEERDEHHGHGYEVEYTLTIPKGAKLDKVDLINGNIDISGVTGTVAASTVNGAIHAEDLVGGCDLKTINGEVGAEFGAMAAESFARLKSVNGAVVLSMPGSSNANVEACTTMGHITNDFGLQSSQESDEDAYVKMGDSIHGKIGKGGASLRVETVNGSIRILKSKGTR